MDQVIVIPVYKKEISDNEKKSLDQCVRIFENRNICLIAPESLDLKNYRSHSDKVSVSRFEDQYFKNIKGYNRLMLSPLLYERFSAYDYMLVCQLDAYVFKDELEYWCNKRYDYIGSPIISNSFVTSWLKHLKRRNLMLKLGIIRNDCVGNGGFSLRKISSFLFNSKLFRKETEAWDLNEDLFWSFRLPVINPLFRIPPMKVAVGFSFEDEPALCYKMNNRQLPFGCHAWEKYDPEFWKKFIL